MKKRWIHVQQPAPAKRERPRTRHGASRCYRYASRQRHNSVQATMRGRAIVAPHADDGPERNAQRKIGAGAQVARDGRALAGVGAARRCRRTRVASADIQNTSCPLVAVAVEVLHMSFDEVCSRQVVHARGICTRGGVGLPGKRRPVRVGMFECAAPQS